MDCFQPNRLDLTVKAVSKVYETAKALNIRLNGECIELCSRRGALLEAIPFEAVQWALCSLPGGIDHCISLQYKSPQPREIVLCARSRAAVVHIVRSLDRAATKLGPEAPSTNPPDTGGSTTPSNDSIIYARTSMESNGSPRAPGGGDDGSPGHSRATCPRCWQLADLLDAHQMQEQKLDSIQGELRASHAKHEALNKELEKAMATVAVATAEERRARKRAAELESCLKDAIEKCEGLVNELKEAGDELKSSEERCKAVEEEKKLLVAALTTAQAQLHDAKSAFHETVSHLELTSKACTATKTQLGALREELKNARDDVERHQVAAREARDQLVMVQRSQQQLKLTMEQNELAWHQEKVSLELALANVTATHARIESAEPSENVVTHIRELTHEVARAHDASSIERQSLHERAQTAEDDARAVRDELQRALQNVAQLQAVLAGTKEELVAERGTAAVARIEGASALKLMESEREKAARAAEKEEAMRAQLTAALTAQTVAVKERNGAESALDQLKVELARAHRRIQALEAQCGKVESTQ